MRTVALCVGIVAIVALAAFAVWAAFGDWARRTSGRLDEGDRVPDVGAPNQDGVAVRLSAFRDRMIVLFFYPKDETSGCTQEVRAFREKHDQIRALGAEIVGVSNDDAGSHKAFCNKEALPFVLLADTDKSIARAFGVRSIFGLYHRITFLIDGEGVVRKVFDPVKPVRHADEVVAAIEGLVRGRAADGQAYLQSRK